MKVYVVTSGEYSDYGIDGMFSTREKAERYVNGSPDRCIEEYELDTASDEQVRRAYRATVVLETGLAGIAGTISAFESWEVAPSTARVPREQEEGRRPWELPYYREHYRDKNLRSFCHRDWDWYCVTSYVSAEHAHKLAVEAYQSYLRWKATEAPAWYISQTRS